MKTDNVSTLYAYDPGQTTGWASFVLARSEKAAALSRWGEFDLWRGIDEQIGSELCQTVVYEKIVPRHPSFNPIGLEVIGAIRYLGELHSRVVVHQMNAQIHGVFKWETYDTLFKTIKSDHSKDAIAHGIVYLRKQGYTIEMP